jgi:hypothetical protein
MAVSPTQERCARPTALAASELAASDEDSYSTGQVFGAVGGNGGP